MGTFKARTICGAGVDHRKPGFHQGLHSGQLNKDLHDPVFHRFLISTFHIAPGVAGWLTQTGYNT